jgi:HD-like signal output (HDOD) protein
MQRKCSMGKLIANADEVKSALAKIQGLQVPSPPALLLSISNELTKPNPDKKKIISQINEDIAISGKVLQIINSPAYGLRNKVKSVEHATNLLGIPKLKNQVIAGALRYALEKSLPGFEAISEYSHCVGIGAQLVAKGIEDLSEEDAYITGLFHEAGTMMMLQLYSDYQDIYSQQRNNPYSFITMEQEKYEASHTVIGFMLAYRWKLADDVCNAIYLSHNKMESIDASMRNLIAAMHVGINLANENILGISCEYGQECSAQLNEAMAILSIDQDKLEDLTDQFNEFLA